MFNVSPNITERGLEDLHRMFGRMEDVSGREKNVFGDLIVALEASFGIWKLDVYRGIELFRSEENKTYLEDLHRMFGKAKDVSGREQDVSGGLLVDG